MDLCFECKKPAEHEHHVIPVVCGGTRTVPLCTDCHEKVHDFKTGFYHLSKIGMEAYWANRRAEGKVLPRKPRGIPTADFKAKVCPIIQGMRDEGLTLRDIAAEMNRMGLQTIRGSRWTYGQIARYLGPSKNPRHRWPRLQITTEVATKVDPVIKKMRNEGMSLRAIANRLDETGTPSPINRKWDHLQVIESLRRSNGEPTRSVGYHRQRMERLKSLSKNRE